MINFMFCEFYHNKEKTPEKMKSIPRLRPRAKHTSVWRRVTVGAQGTPSRASTSGTTVRVRDSHQGQGPVLRAISPNQEATVAPQMDPEEHELLIRDPQPHGFLAIAHPLYRQPVMDGRARRPLQEWHGHSPAATQRAWGPWAHVRACNLAGGSVAVTAITFLRPESM